MKKEQTLTYRWVILFVAWLTSFTCALTTFCYPPLLNEVMISLQMSISQAGMLMSLTTLTTMSFNFIGGILSEKFGTKITMGAGIAIITISQITMSIVNSYSIAAFLRLLLGVGIGIATICLIKAVSEWFPSKELAMAQSIQATGWALGNTLGLFLAIPLTRWLNVGWKGAFLSFGVFSLVLNLIFWLLFKESSNGLRKKKDIQKQSREKMSSLLKVRELWILTIGLSGAFSSSSIVMTWLPKSLIDVGWSDVYAAQLSTIIPLVGIPANLVGGILSDRLGKRKPLIGVSSIFLILSYAALLFDTRGTLVWIAAATSGWFNFFFIGPFLAIPSELPEIGQERSGMFIGIVQMLSGIAGFISPMAVGWIREITGSFVLGFAFSSISSALLLIPAIFGRETGWNKSNKN
jgi:cyanate permease